MAKVRLVGTIGLGSIFSGEDPNKLEKQAIN